MAVQMAESRKMTSQTWWFKCSAATYVTRWNSRSKCKFSQNECGYLDVLQPDLVADNHNNYCDVPCIIGFHNYRYDFDKDGTITAEDVDRVLSYIPLNTRPINTYSAAPTANKSLSGKLNKNSRG